jgi:4-hydroxyphenylpyruvate dioxygenase
LLLTTPLDPDSDISEHIRKHGDGVRDIAFRVEDAKQAFHEAVERGAEPAIEPHDITDEHGTATHAAIKTLRRHASFIHFLQRLQGSVSSRLRRAQCSC